MDAEEQDSVADLRRELVALKRQLEEREERRREQLASVIERAGFTREAAEARAAAIADTLEIDRRTGLHLLAAAAVGSSMGSAGMWAATETARADASTSDSDGDVGLPNDRVDVFADGVDATTLTIGGTLYEEDDNSPLNPSNSSSETYTVAGSYSDLILIVLPDGGGYNRLRVNGDTGSNYNHVDNADSRTTGATEWPIPRDVDKSYIHLRATSAEVAMAVVALSSATGQTVGGDNGNVSGDITQFTVFDGGGTNRSTKIRIYGRVV